MPRATSTSVLLLVCTVVTAATAGAQQIRTRTSQAAFEDVKFEINNAIMARGLVVDYNPRISDMIARTGPDVGSTKQIYRIAEYMTFCSAKLTRQGMEADPVNIAFCPYVIFIYETEARPGEVVVGYRVPVSIGSRASKQAIGAVDKLLGEIIRDAVK